MVLREKRDCISSLPDELINEMVPCLGAEEAAYLTTVSRRFRNLFDIIEELEFDDPVEYQQNFSGYVTAELARLETTTRIRKFTLRSAKILDPEQVNNWLREVLKHGINDLELDIAVLKPKYLHLNIPPWYSLPAEIFTCATVVKMKLGRKIVITAFPRNSLLPALKNLILESVRFYSFGECAFQALLLACPVLQELFIDGMYWETWRWSGILASRSLQRLTIARDMSRMFVGPGYQGITFETPSLSYLKYADFVPDAYPVVDFGSLVEAKLTLQVLVGREWYIVMPEEGDLLSSNPTNLLMGIKKVHILEISASLTLETLYFFRDAIPVFENLHQLTITNDGYEACWKSLPFLLNKTPNLEKLIIECGLHFAEDGDYLCWCVSEYNCLKSCPISTLELTLWHNGDVGELEQVKYFLQKLSHLQLLIIRFTSGICASEKLRIISELQLTQKASTTCTIRFI